MSLKSVLALTFCALSLSSYVRAQEGTDEAPNLLVAAEEDASVAEKPDQWNEFDGEFATLRIGGGFLVDTASYRQDDNSLEQMNLQPMSKLRDARLLFKGRFPKAPRISYTIGYMYDGGYDVWRFRQTGLVFAVPEMSGSLFVGRTKEGFSTNKLMVGYHGWTNERSAANDAFLPILADGIRWTGSFLSGKMVYNIGTYGNLRTPEYQTYVKTENSSAARLVWVPNARTNSPTAMHFAIEGRHGSAVDGKLQFRSKPESYEAQSYAVDTGKFPATASDMLGFEAYYRPGPLMFGSEYYLNKVSSSEKEDPFFQGGEVFMAYLFTGEVHPYNETGAFFQDVIPQRSAFNGGLGALEFVLRYSYVDLKSKLIDGGRFWRITPMFNWYLSQNARLEFVYGYGELDRFDLKGSTQFFQTRLQLSL